MSNRHRLQQFADEVKAAGLRGESMQSKLAAIVQREDLTPHQIRRIAEMANRDVHVALTKDAHAKKADARIKFELADPEKLVGGARKTAELSGSGERSKVAEAIEDAGGDPFAAPVRHANVKLSLFDAPLDPKLAFAQREAESRKILLGLDRSRHEIDALRKEATSATIETTGAASSAHDQAVQSAIELVQSGVTLPSLYLAVMAAVEGDEAGARNLMSLVVTGLKARGVPNHKMGFRYPGELGAIDALSTEDLLALCDRSLGYTRGEMTKRAARYMESVPEHGTTTLTGKHPYEDAAAWLVNRPSVRDHKLPQSYLDEKNTGNLPNGKPRVINADSEFVIGVRNLVGARDRLRKLRNADEFMGRKLEEISRAMGGVKEAQLLTAEAYTRQMVEIEEQKQAIGPVLAAAAAVGRGLMTAANVAGTVGGVASAAKKQPATAPERTVHAAAAAAMPKMSFGDKLTMGANVANAGIGIASVAQQLMPKPSEPKAKKDKHPGAPASGVGV